MKILLATLALAFAAPVAAQTAPAQPDHQQHGQHQEHQPAQHQQHGNRCCADRNGNGRMDCCEQAAQSGQACACCDEQPAQRR